MDVVELRLRSAEDLKDVRRVRVGKLLHPLSASAWITPAPAPLRKLPILPPHHISANLQAAAPAEEDGTLFPTWSPNSNSDITIQLHNARALVNNFLVIRLYAHRASSALPTRKRPRLVGTITVPFGDIVNDGGHNRWQLFSYNVKLPSGRRHGVLNFSARFSQACRLQQPMAFSHIPQFM